MNSKNIGLKRMPKKKRTQNKDVKFYLMILPKKNLPFFFTEEGRIDILKNGKITKL